MLEIGNRIPEARVWTTPQENATLAQLASDGPILLFFYLFDWSST
jgi:peroxiredoxin